MPEPTQEQTAQADDAIDHGSKFPAMSYEQGVSAALRWVSGDEDEPPMSDD